jgi:hypothetical protein
MTATATKCDVHIHIRFEFVTSRPDSPKEVPSQEPYELEAATARRAWWRVILPIFGLIVSEAAQQYMRVRGWLGR